MNRIGSLLSGAVLSLGLVALLVFNVEAQSSLCNPRAAVLGGSNSGAFISTSQPIAAAILPSGANVITISYRSQLVAQSIEVPVSSTTSLDDIVTIFNSAATALSAEVVNSGSSANPAYSLVFWPVLNSHRYTLEVEIGTDISSLGVFNNVVILYGLCG